MKAVTQKYTVSDKCVTYQSDAILMKRPIYF